jgi:hypothetical protein
VNEAAVQGPDGLLFLVLRSPAQAGRITALFLPLSEAAAEKYVSKITHYGKYGSLLLQEEPSVIKGLWLL